MTRSTLLAKQRAVAIPARPASNAVSGSRLVSGVPGGLRGGLLSGLLSAALAATASRPWGLGLLGLICYAPAFATILHSRGPLAGALTAYLAALGVVSVGYEATVGIFPGAYAAALVLAPLPFAVAGAVAVRFGRSAAVARLPGGWRSPTSALALVALMTAAEFLSGRPQLLGVWALPLSALGYSQIDLPTVRLAAVSSVTAVSAFLMATNACAALALLRFGCVSLGQGQARPARVSVLSLLALLALCLGASLAAVPAPSTPLGSAGAPLLQVRLVQPNRPDSVYAAAAELPAVRHWLSTELVELLAAPTASPSLTLLPEAAWPGVLDPNSAANVAQQLLPYGVILMGAVTRGWPTNATADGLSATANSVLLVADGSALHVYDKRRLVPIAEAPLVAGPGAVVLDLAGHEVAPLICYDIVFASDVRAAVLAGANLLTVHTDDSFAARSDVPALHLRVARMRAIETARPVALVANTGPSAVIAADGSVLAATQALEATTVSATLPAPGGKTPYVRFGDWLGAASVAVSLAVGSLGVAGGGAPELDSGPT